MSGGVSKHVAAWDLSCRMQNIHMGSPFLCHVTIQRTNALSLLGGIAKTLAPSWGLPLRQGPLRRKPMGQGRKRKAAAAASPPEEEDLAVECILAKRVCPAKLVFEWQVKWLGFDGTDEERSWEPLECLVGCQDMLYKYEAALTPEFQKRLQAELVALLVGDLAKHAKHAKQPAVQNAISNNPFSALAAGPPRIVPRMAPMVD